MAHASEGRKRQGAVELSGGFRPAILGKHSSIGRDGPPRGRLVEEG